MAKATESDTVITKSVPRDLWAEVKAIAARKYTDTGKALVMVMREGIPIIKAKMEEAQP